MKYYKTVHEEKGKVVSIFSRLLTFARTVLPDLNKHFVNPTKNGIKIILIILLFTF